MMRKSLILTALFAGLMLAAADSALETTAQTADAKPAASTAQAPPAEEAPPVKHADSLSLIPDIGVLFPVKLDHEIGKAGISLTGGPGMDRFRSGLILNFLGEDYSRTNVSGLSVGWIGTAREQTGLQIALIGLNGYDDWNDGLSFRDSGTSTGQISVFSDIVYQLKGFQIAGIGAVGSNVSGLQAAGIGTMAKQWCGVQIAGLFTMGIKGSGLQIAPLNVSGMEFRNNRLTNLSLQPTEPESVVQVGLENVSGRGDWALQIGLVNHKSGKGFQIGLWNCLGNDYFPGLPLINW